MGVWETYKRVVSKMNDGHLDKKDPLDIFVKDAPELREQIVWTQRILDTETPSSKAYHEWMATRSALAAHVDEVEHTYNELVSDPSEDKAQAFSDAMEKAAPALKRAKNVFWINSFHKTHGSR